MALAGETIVAADALTGAWAAWTPSWTASSGTAPALGNGTLLGQFKQVGNTVLFDLVLVWGSTTTGGSGGAGDGVGLWQFSLPVAAAADFCAAASLRDNSVPANRAGSADGRSGAAATALLRTAASSGAAVNAATPFTWATGDTFKITGMYEAA